MFDKPRPILVVKINDITIYGHLGDNLSCKEFVNKVSSDIITLLVKDNGSQFVSQLSFKIALNHKKIILHPGDIAINENNELVINYKRVEQNVTKIASINKNEEELLKLFSRKKNSVLISIEWTE